MAIQTVWKSGNSLVITLPQDIAHRLKIQQGSTVALALGTSGRLTITPVWSRTSSPRTRIRRQLKHLVQRK